MRIMSRLVSVGLGIAAAVLMAVPASAINQVEVVNERQAFTAAPPLPPDVHSTGEVRCR